MRIRVSPTPSITPSHTPTITPSLTSCPTYGFKTNIKLFECNYGQTQVGLPLTGWTVEHSGVTYTGLTQYTSPQDATWCNIPVQEPFVGASYIFNLTELPAGWELCANNNFGVAWDSFDVVLTGYTGRNCYSLTECVLDYTGVINYYLGGILQSSQNEVIQFIEYLVSENTSCSPSYTMFNQVMGFIVDIIRPTPTPTVTQTQTPSPTSCYQPKAYILFDSQTGATALNTWMASQGSAFRGMFLNAPSLVPATFEAQMNAYISYSGFGPSQYYALLPQNITPNQNPIIWNEGIYPPWEGTFVWVNMFVPTCPICPDGEYGLMGANGAAIHTTNDFRRSIPFYYSGTAIPQGFYRLYTTYAGTDMRLSSSGSEYILGDLVCPTTPTPTPTNTQTRTPTSTPTGTLPVTPTQTSTPTTTPQVSPTQTQTSTPTRTPEVSPTNTQTSTPTNTQTSTPTGTPQATPTQTQTPSPSGGITCIQVIDTVIGPEPQTGINNFFGVNISLSPYPVTENVTVTGYIRDDGNISNTYDFSITVIGGTQSGETANNVLTTGPADTATIFITGITPSVVTYAGNSVYICGLEPEPTPTMTPTPSTTPPCTNTIFTHGALRVTCSDFCNTNYLIGTTDCATETYFNLSIGDFIYGYSGQTGFLAYSNVSTDTNTGPFRIADIDGSGEILGLYVCSGGSCIPL